MKKTQHLVKWSSLLAMFSLTIFANELGEHLVILEPLIETQWVGGYVNDQSIQIKLDFKSILDGKAIQYLRKAEILNYSATTHFYWDLGLEALRFLTLDSRGNTGEGIVTSKKGSFILSGKNKGSNGTAVFRTVWDITPDGRLKDTYYRQKNETWVLGHEQEFVRN